MPSTTLRALLAVIFIAGSGTAFGQLYWNTNGTSATWTASNWGSVPAGPYTAAWTANSNAIFNANSTVTFATTSVGNVTVADGLTVTVTTNGTLSTNNTVRTFDIGTGSTLTWSSQSVSNNSASGFIKNGAGTWNLGAGSGSNLYTGGFTLNQGTVIATGQNSFGGANSVLTVNGGTIQSSGGPTFANSSIVLGGDFTNTGTGNTTFSGTVALGSATRTITNNATGGSRNFSGAISGSAGTGLIFAGSGVTTLSGANTYTGATTVSGGTLRAGADSVAGTSGAFGLNSNVSLANVAGATLDLNGFNTQIGSLSGGGTTGGNVTLGAGTLSVGGGTASGSTTTYSGAISGTGGVTKVGSGIQVLSGANSYTGVSTVSAGTLVFNTTGSLYNGNSGNWTDTNIVVNSGGILAVTLGGANGFLATQVQSISQLGTATGGLKDQSYFGIDTSNGDQTYSNVIANTNTAGSNQIGFAKLGANTLTLTADNTYSLSSNGTRVFGGTLQVGDGGTTGRLGTGTASLSSGTTLAFKRGDNITITNGISGAGGVSQIGTGILTFSTAKSYFGQTNVTTGTLRLAVSGSINNSPTIIVASGATYDVSSLSSYTLGSGANQTLQGAGTVTGGVTVASLGTIRGDSGSGTGTLTTGNVTVQSGGKLGVQLGTGTTASRLNTSAGILNLNSGAIIDPNGSFDGGGDRVLATLGSGTGKLIVGGTSYDSSGDIATYTYATGDTGLKTFGALQLDVTGLGLNDGEKLVLSRNASNQLVLTFTPVPEPASMLAVCGLVVGGVVAVRKLQRKGKPTEVTPAA